MVNEQIPLFYPYVNEEMREAVDEVLHSRFIGQGPKVDEFEKQFCKKFNVPYAVSVNSGTSSLEQAYDWLKLGPGDKVISTPLTCSATNIPLLHRGVEIIWADIDPDTLCISQEDVWKKFNQHYDAKAIIQVHLGGIQANAVDRNRATSLKYTTVPVISDAAQALGIFTGDITCNSFQAIKHITTGDGGMTVINSEESYQWLKRHRWFGIDREHKIANNWQATLGRLITCDIKEAGHKRHMNDIAASMGIVGLKYYDEIITHRKKIFNIYKEELKNVPGLRIVDGEVNKYWLATVIVDKRDDLLQKLFEANIDANVVQTRNDILTIFGGERQNLPNMNKLEFSYFSLPLNMNVTEDNAKYVSSIIRKGW